MTQKKKVVNELRALDVQALGERLVNLDKDLFSLRNELAMNKKLDKPHLIKKNRLEKSQILTVLAQKQYAADELYTTEVL